MESVHKLAYFIYSLEIAESGVDIPIYPDIIQHIHSSFPC